MFSFAELSISSMYLLHVLCVGWNVPEVHVLNVLCVELKMSLVPILECLM